MSITIFSQGAAGEVTGSRHFLQTDSAKILVDCGAFQGKRKESDEKNRNFDINTDNLESVILTHGHFDHIGGLNAFKENNIRIPSSKEIYINKIQ